MKIWDQTSWWCSHSDTVQTNILADHGGFPFSVAIYWSHCSLSIPAVDFIVSWWLSGSVWINWHSVVCCILLYLLSALQTIFKSVSCVTFSVAQLATSWCSIWCLRCCCASASGILDEAPDIELNSDPLTPGWDAFWAMLCCCGKGEEVDTEKKWNISRDILSASTQYGMSDSQLACSTQEESYGTLLQVAEVSNHPAICSKSFRCCLWFTRKHCCEWQRKSHIW